MGKKVHTPLPKLKDVGHLLYSLIQWYQLVKLGQGVTAPIPIQNVDGAIVRNAPAVRLVFILTLRRVRTWYPP